MQEGFIFDSLEDYYKNFFRDLKKKFPEKATEFLKTEARKYLKVAKKRAKKEIGTSKGKKKDWIESKSYQKGFKIGKIYDYSGDMCLRAYNKARHAHLIEYGHINVPRGENKSKGAKRRSGKGGKGVSFAFGSFIFKYSEMDFRETYLIDADTFMYNFFKERQK